MRSEDIAWYSDTLNNRRHGVPKQTRITPCVSERREREETSLAVRKTREIDHAPLLLHSSSSSGSTHDGLDTLDRGHDHRTLRGEERTGYASRRTQPRHGGNVLNSVLSAENLDMRRARWETIGRLCFRILLEPF